MSVYWICALLLPHVVLILADDSVNGPCVDEKSSLKCKFWKRHGSCTTHQNRMMKFCAKTCSLCPIKTACKSMKCPKNKFCTINSQGKPHCACSLNCKLKSLKKKLGSVCGTDGRNYINICKMQYIACEQDRTILVNHFGKCPVDDGCKDEQSKNLCLGWQKAGACKVYVPLMKRYCRKTCNMCEKRAAAPVPNCKNTIFGCCPDGKTFASGLNGKGCPIPCKDKYRFCQRFTIDCINKHNYNRKFMKKHCPKSCGYCR